MESALKSSSMNILFIFGAGISAKSGLPLTKQLTNDVLALRLGLQTDGRFGPGQDQAFDGVCWADVIQKLFRFLRKSIAEYRNQAVEEITYEDIGDLLSLLDRELGTYRNPAFRTWIPAVKNEFPDELRIVALKAITSRAVVYLASAVFLELRKIQAPQGFEWLKDMLKIKGFDFNYVTLNHDSLLETFMNSIGCSLDDGFYDVGKFNRFDGKRFYESNQSKLVKLHGSIDWCLCGDLYLSYVVRPHANCPPSQDFIDYLWQNRAEEGPRILIGTHNKLIDYNYSIFPHLLAAFENLLNSTDKIVVSGYSFSDAGANLRIFDWLARQTNRCMVIIHPDPDNALQNHKDLLANHQINKFKELGRLTFLKCGFEDTKSNEVISALFEDANAPQNDQQTGPLNDLQ